MFRFTIFSIFLFLQFDQSKTRLQSKSITIRPLALPEICIRMDTNFIKNLFKCDKCRKLLLCPKLDHVKSFVTKIWKIREKKLKIRFETQLQEAAGKSNKIFVLKCSQNKIDSNIKIQSSIIFKDRMLRFDHHSLS